VLSAAAVRGGTPDTPLNVQSSIAQSLAIHPVQALQDGPRASFLPTDAALQEGRLFVVTSRGSTTMGCMRLAAIAAASVTGQTVVMDAGLTAA
jgi:hypothetical protein